MGNLLFWLGLLAYVGAGVWSSWVFNAEKGWQDGSIVDDATLGFLFLCVALVWPVFWLVAGIGKMVNWYDKTSFTWTMRRMCGGP